MASYNELLALIDAYINQNGVQAITGQVLNGVLRAMVDQLGRGYSIMGIADPTTDPGTPDGPESWFASVPGTYTNFGGLEVADAEFAMFSYTPSTGWTKATLTEGITEVAAGVDDNVGTPSAEVTYQNGALSFQFYNLKGQTGDAAGFGNVSATVDGNIGTPGVTVQASGPDTAKNFVFNFTNLKGETGVTSVLATVDNTSGNPQCAVSLNGQQLVLNFTGLKGAQGDTGSSVDYPFTIVNNLTTDDATQALSAAQGVVLAGQVSQLEHKVNKEMVKKITISDVVAGTYNSTTGAPESSTASVRDEGYFSVLPGMRVFIVTGYRYKVIYYDKSKTVIAIPGNTWSYSPYIDIPTNCHFLRFSFNDENNGVTPLTFADVYLTPDKFQDEIDVILDELKSKDSKITLADFTEIGNYYISNSSPQIGELKSSSAWKTYKLNVENKTVSGIAVLSSSTNSVLAVSYYSDFNSINKDTLISGIPAVIENERNYIINIKDIPDGCKAICICNKTELGTISFTGSLSYSNRLNSYGSRISALEESQSSGDSGYVRFIVQQSAGENYTEYLRCKATGLPIRISDSIDFVNTDGTARTIDMDGVTLIFAGNGQIKNCQITGGVKVDAGLHKVFDNVYFHKWSVNGTEQVNKDSVYNMYLADTSKDVYNRATKTLSSASTSTAYNPFKCSFTVLKIGSFASPSLVSGKYVYQESGVTKLTLEDDGNGNIKIPIRKDYLFLDGGTIVESTYDIKTKTASYVYVSASDLTITRLFAPVKTLTGGIDGNVFPEWWGASNSGDSTTAFQCAFLHGKDIQLSADYTVSGGLRVFGDTKLSGNKRSITLSANSSESSMLEIETVSGLQDGIIIYDLTLDGNKSNQNDVQDGIFADFKFGLVPFSGYSIDNTYWYNINVKNFTGSGVCVAVPGTSHIYSSYFAFNNYDGITWDNEHFTLVNVTCWTNGRHGAYASGNHWRIIGGAFAHNKAGDNIHCDNAVQCQVIGCSTIDSGKFVASAGGAYVADAQATYGYSYVGEGLGTHELIGGNGINLQRCQDMTLIGVRINNQNANGVLAESSYRINMTMCQFNQNNETSNPSFKDVSGDVIITNSFLGYTFVDTNQLKPVQNFGKSGGSQDWNDLLHTAELVEGVNYLADYFNAAHRPSGAGTYLEGSVTCKSGISGTVFRTYIRMMDETGKLFVRYVNINKTTGAYTSDSGWKSLIPTT